ncbi:MAG: MBOAT family protein [Lachnospiraceae bacterium]|nr:MBOAT family protein [Lachnospiraceae bacterium]
MAFDSLTFLLFFLPGSLILYYAVPFRAKNWILAAVSLLFYAWGDPISLIVLVYSILVNYALGRLLGARPEHRKAVLAIDVVLNLLVLCFFRYYSPVLTLIDRLLPAGIALRSLPVPLGLAIFTLQAIAYMVDLYRGKYPAEKNFIRFTVYLSCFPVLPAGPIVRYSEVGEQLKAREVSFAKLGKGLIRFVFGLAKKVLLADSAAMIFDTVRALPDTTVLGSWLAVLSFAFRIYLLLSSFSDMAIGLLEAFGFEIPENFTYPYMAHSVTNFWKRWFNSLGRWFGDYLYLPCGGRRVKILGNIALMLLIFALTGLFFGTGLNYLAWGLYFGILVLSDRYLFRKLKLPKFIGAVFTLFFVLMGWVLFFSGSVPEAIRFYPALFGVSASAADNASLYVLLRYGILLFLQAFACFPLLRKLYELLTKKLPGRILVYLAAAAVFVFTLVYLVTGTSDPLAFFRL